MKRQVLRCIVRPDFAEFANSRFEVQMKSVSGWRTVIEFGPDEIINGWEILKDYVRNRKRASNSLYRNGR